MEANSDIFLADLERNRSGQAFLMNNTVHNFAWKNVIVTVKDRQTKRMRDLICDINGCVKQSWYTERPPNLVGNWSILLLTFGE